MALVTQTFTSNTTWTVPATASVVDVFLVGGGGGGGYDGGGGGGGGRVRYHQRVGLSPGETVAITIGNGGGGGTSFSSGTGFNGGTTRFVSSTSGVNLTAIGGGGGRNVNGSGGDSGINLSLTTGTSSATYTGGSGLPATGGGGGASATGNGFNSNAGTNAQGGSNGYTFRGQFYGGGGGGGCDAYTSGEARPLGFGEGGVDDGGDGGSENQTGDFAAANTGGGGGGGASAGASTQHVRTGVFPTFASPEVTYPARNGGAGGSGIIIVVYDSVEYELTKSAAGVSEGGSITVTLFTKNIPNGINIPYTITGASASDFSPAILTGNFTISSTDGGQTGVAAKTLTIAADTTTEGNETVTLALNNGLASIQFTLGDFSRTQFTRAVDTVGDFVVGKQYEILTVGTTIWTALGAASNTIGVSFTATGSGTVSATSIVSGRSYTIRSLADTDFTLIGASTNAVGVTFTASGAGLGVGTAVQGNGTAYGPWISKTVQVADYNSIRNKVAGVLGTGSADSGYGQTVQSSEVTTSSKVLISQWSSLRYDIINAWIHQFGTTPALTVAPSTGATLKANSLTEPYSQWESYADVIVANKFFVHSSQSATFSKGTQSETWPGTYGSTWNSLLSCTVTVTFTSAANARYFFNSGGEIRFASSRTGGSTTGEVATQNNSWTTLLTTAGTIPFGADKPGQGVNPNDGSNYYRLRSTYDVFYNLSSTTPYSANLFRISARTPSVADNSTGTASTIEFLVEWVDNHISVFGSSDAVDGTVSLNVTTLEATGILQPSGTGSFLVESPTVTISSITP